MVQVIDDRYDAGGENYLVFRVYKEHGEDTVYGYLLPHSYYDDNGALQVVRTDKDVEAGKALPKAAELAAGHGFKFLLIHDLDNLFPQDMRPAIK